MCGVCGLLSLAPGEPPAATIRPMVAALRHRGPDGEAIVAREHIVMGHTRLAIRGGDAARQPMESPSGRGLLVFNGEIYNTEELKRRMGLAGESIAGGDTRILALWLDQEGSLSALNGMFALAWWRQDLKQLWLVRDRFGIKPLYYVELAHGYAFASELRSLAALSGWSSQPNMEEVWPYLVATPSPSGPGLWQGVMAVAPGEVVRFDARAGKVSTESYAERPGAGPAASPGEPLEPVLIDAVARQLVSERPVCVSLSGGLDSSLLAALSSEVGQPLAAYTADWQESRAVETPYIAGRDYPFAEKVAEHLDLPLTRVAVSPKMTERRIFSAIAHKSLPLSHTTEVALQELYRVIGRNHTVVMTGEGADEMWHGYHFFTRRQTDRLPWASTGFEDLEAIFTARFLSLWSVRDRLAELADRYRDMTLQEAFFVGFLPYLLERLDRHSMTYSVEARVPFLDNELLRFGGPGSRDGETEEGKSALRRIARGRLPEEVVQRPKSAFPPSLSSPGAQSVLRLLRERRRDGRSRVADWLQPGALETLGRQAGSMKGNILAWRILNLDLWCQWMENPVLDQGSGDYSGEANDDS